MTVIAYINRTECAKVETETGAAVRLLRLRNPWGQGHGEWRGAWSDNAPEWKTVDEAGRRQLDVQFGPDGEFWMRLDDYINYFHTTSVCSLAPDFDRDGLDDGLSQLPAAVICQSLFVLFNPLQGSGGRWLHFEVFSAIQV